MAPRVLVAIDRCSAACSSKMLVKYKCTEIFAEMLNLTDHNIRTIVVDLEKKNVFHDCQTRLKSNPGIVFNQNVKITQKAAPVETRD